MDVSIDIEIALSSCCFEAGARVVANAMLLVQSLLFRRKAGSATGHAAFVCSHAKY